MSKDIAVNGKEGHMHGNTGLYKDYDNEELKKKKDKVAVKALNSKYSHFDNYILGQVVLKNIVVNKNKEITSIKKKAIKSLCKHYKFKGIKFLIHNIGIKGILIILFSKGSDYVKYKIEREYKIASKEVVRSSDVASRLLRDK